eukprot:scaffold6708_cov134-Cylindrotheca_fusiformis.AAC.35
MAPKISLEHPYDGNSSSSSSDYMNATCASVVAYCEKTEQSPPSTPRSIRFALEQTQIHPVLSRCEYTVEEARGSWFSREEKAKMFVNHDKTVERMESGKRPKKNSSYRGLENFAQSNAIELEKIIHACIDAVMDEQARQWRADILDWDRYASVSKEVSEESLSLALKMAGHDRRQAIKAYKKMNQRKPSSSSSLNTNNSERDGDSVSTEITNSTLTHEMKDRHNRSSSTTSKKSSKGRKSGRPPKSRSSGSRNDFSKKLDKLKRKSVPHNKRLQDLGRSPSLSALHS